MSSVKNRMDKHAGEIAELRARVEALEAAQPKAKKATKSQEIPQQDGET